MLISLIKKKRMKGIINNQGLILKKYRPSWIMYPKCYKDTDEAKKGQEVGIKVSEKVRQGDKVCEVV